MSLVNKHKQWVLETVDRLRQRKARPDLERISRMVERFHGLTPAETKESLDKLCEEGVVLKVHFKGNISYRHIRKAQTEPNDVSSQKYETSCRILSAVNVITRQTGDGVEVEDLEQWLISKDPDTRLVKHRLINALHREIENGSITKLPDNCYVLTASLPKEKKTQRRPVCNMKRVENKVEPPQTAQQPVKEKCVKEKSAANENVKENTEEVKDPKPVKENAQNNDAKDILRRGRPLSKRKVR